MAIGRPEEVYYMADGAEAGAQVPEVSDAAQDTSNAVAQAAKAVVFSPEYENHVWEKQVQHEAIRAVAARNR